MPALACRRSTRPREAKAWIKSLEGLLRAVFSRTLREVVKVSDAADTAGADRLVANVDGEMEGSDASSLEAMEPLDVCDFQPKEQFPLKWRWTDPKWNELPPEKLSRIRPLAAIKATEIHSRAMALLQGLALRRDLFSQIRAR
jgi:hypothetical protein